MSLRPVIYDFFNSHAPAQIVHTCAHLCTIPAHPCNFIAYCSQALRPCRLRTLPRRRTWSKSSDAKGELSDGRQTCRSSRTSSNSACFKRISGGQNISGSRKRGRRHGTRQFKQAWTTSPKYAEKTILWCQSQFSFRQLEAEEFIDLLKGCSAQIRSYRCTVFFVKEACRACP